MRLSKAVVLGHTGFIGRALTRELELQGLAVSGYSSSDLDLTKREDLSRLDGRLDAATILVLASALTLDRAADTVDTFSANLAMAAHLSRYLEAHPVGLCVYLSSFTVYGDVPGARAIDEETPASPVTLYAAAKYAGERLLAVSARKAAFPLLNLRLGRVYGPGVRRAVYGPAAFVRSIEEDGLVELFGDGEESRDHLYIEDAARLIARLAADGRCGTYNVVSGESHSYLDVIAALKRVSPKPFRVVGRPRTRPTTRLARFDASKLMRDAPFKPTSLEQGLRRTFHG